jgi:hypothetical protein
LINEQRRNLNTFLHIIYRLVLLYCFLGCCTTLKAGNCTDIPISSDTVPKNQPPKKRSNIARYFNIITDQQQRDSLFLKLAKTNAPVPMSDSAVFKMRQSAFDMYGGKQIRYIYYNRLKVFGTTIEDTTVVPSNLIRFANRLHYDTRTWVIKQSLFFQEGDTVNAYKLVDNERYLRRLPFILDARIYVINSYENNDSIDIVVLTKDVFEYGGSITQINGTQAAATVYNNNLLGAGQRVAFGFSWNNSYTPQWRTGASYTKYNVAGSFADVAVGYTMLNDKLNTDTGQYENSAYITINRPLYSTWATFTGGLTVSANRSVNILSLPDTIYRDYKYNLVDAWAGYNFTNQYKKTGYNSKKPNMGVELRSFNMNFTQRPTQDTLQGNPKYNSHNFLLGQLVFYHQDFFKTNYFFGFGRTEDIPLGYTYALSYAVDKSTGLIRSYTALQAQKYWLPGKNLISTTVGFGGFWNSGKSEDAVLHVSTDYYSNLFRISGQKMREFLHVDYIVCYNPVLYKYEPVNINRDNGIFSYRNTLFNNFQRLNVSAQTNYYSPISIYGFKFNFYLLLQASLLASEKEPIVNSPFYSGITLGFQIRNENLSFNTLQISASYQPLVSHGPQAANGPSSIFIYVTSVIPFNFPIFALNQPTLIQYR